MCCGRFRSLKTRERSATVWRESSPKTVEGFSVVFDVNESSDAVIEAIWLTPMRLAFTSRTRCSGIIVTNSGCGS